MDVGLWRRISLWLWFACLLMAVYSAPVNEDGSSPAAVDGSDNGFDSAIEAVARAKRDTRKKSSKSSRSLVRYRYPIQFKRSAGIQHDDEEVDDYDGNSAEDEDSAAAAAGLVGSTDALDRLDHDNAVDLDELAKEIALDILMEEADKSRPEHRSSSPLIKKKKAAPTAHRPSRYLSLDDKRRKRMNSLVNQLLDQESAAAGPLDNEDDDEEEQQPEEEEEEERVAADEEEDEEDEPLEAMARALANQGLERSEIENLLSQLERLQSSEEETNGERKKKKRSSDWRKLPRASLRWRFLHSHGYDDNEPSFGRHQSPDDADEPTLYHPSNPVFDQRQGDKSIPFENRFFGRGFHRVGPSIQEEQAGRGIPPSVLAAKRVQHPLKTKNAVSIMNKRSIVSEEEEETASQKEQVAPASSVPTIRSQRKRRSPSADGESKLNETSPPPLALPLAESKQAETEPKKNKSSETATTVRNKDAHSGGIRKKSVDWDDYFGYDKRSSGGDDEAMRDYLESEYYKTMAGSLAYRKRSGDEQQHAGHGMKKRNNATAANWEKKKKRRDASLQDAEEALDAAFRAVEEQGGGDIERLREQLVAELVENLDEDELEEMTDRLAEELARAIRQEEEEQEEAEEDERNFKKRYAKKKRVSHKKKKSTDERRKRFAVKRSGRHRPAESDGDDCVIAEQVVSTCNMVSHLYGGYRPVLSDACFRHQACFICSDNEAACDVEFQQRVLALCGPDLLCQSQSRHLLSALGQLDQMEVDYLAPMGGPPRVEALCRRDSCLAEFWKRR